MSVEKVPLLKALQKSGFGSRRELASLIMQGKIRINGNIISDLKYPIDLKSDSVFILGKKMDLSPETKLVLMANKPAGTLSTTRDEHGRKTIMDILPDQYRDKHLYPAGRLDKDTTGLLLLTNDGYIAYELTHPKFEHEKEYLVQIEGSLKSSEEKVLEKGIVLEDGLTSPAVVKKISNPPFNYSITIHQGRKRQIRRMFEYLGHSVLLLKRIRLGNLKLGNLKEGAVRKISPNELKLLKEK